MRISLLLPSVNVLASVLASVYTSGRQSPHLTHPKMIGNSCVFLVSAHLTGIIEIDINIAHDISSPE